MNRLAILSAAAWLVTIANPVGAQMTKTLTGEAKTMSVTVEAIEQSSRSVTVKKPDGTYEVLHIPATIKRFDTLKVGDKINAKYYENIVMQFKSPDGATIDTGAAAVTKAQGGQAAVTSSKQRTITATIAAIDKAAPSVTFTGPNGWKYTGRVMDTKVLEKVKVGDRFDITWTEALLLSIEDGK